MNLDDMILVSVDDHVVEPRHIFEGRMPAKYADRAPRVVSDGENETWIFEGESAQYMGLNAVVGRPAEQWGLNPTGYDQMRKGCWDIDARIVDMNADGVLASLNFPTFPQFCGQYFARQKDKDLALATVRAYNDWHIDEWAGTHPGRIIPCALLPIWDPELMAAEVIRVSEKGCHAVAFSENPYKLGFPSLHTPHWDPFYKACNDHATVVCTHLGSSSELPVTSPDAPMDVTVVLLPSSLQAGATDIILSGVFTRFPNLKWALAEGGIGWIPYLLERLDYCYKRHSTWTGADLKGRTPSEMFHHHIITCFIEDEVGLAMRDRIGIDTICLESDYPHADSSWPLTPERIHKAGADLSDSEINKITHQNALRNFNFDPFAHIPREQATVGALRALVGDIDLTFDDGRVAVKGGHGSPIAHQYQRVDG
jgi:predicted TIM-barrel fold metal-dependent hydrolase